MVDGFEYREDTACMSKRTSMLYRMARLSADMDAVQKGPRAVAKRQARKVAYKATSRFLRALFK